MDFWVLALAVNFVVGVCYFAIAGIIGRGIHTTGQWRSNPLATATFLIFLSCGVGHATHVEHLLAPGSTLEASRVAFDLHLVLVDAVTATIAIYYFFMRAKFPALLQGTAMFEDLTLRRTQALDIHDSIVQQLATAKLALETGHGEMGMQALSDGLEASRKIITELLHDDVASTATPEPGGLRRDNEAPV